jgi:tetratricopeptide (TPR) repeat protein
MRFLLVLIASTSLLAAGELESARDRQDRAALAKLASGSPYQVALAKSYLSEVALELRDKREARIAAEAGIAAAREAIAADPNKAEYHRLLGTLCGQVIPADPLAGFQHGKCAKQEIEKALSLDPKSALAWVSSGVGKYYLPPMLGGGLDLALKDFEKATALNPKLADAWLWIGLAHRKAGRNAEARKALEKAQSLNPQRIWIKQQLEKTPAS